MNHYQQQHYAHAGGTPISPYYAARQRFEQQAQVKPAQPAGHSLHSLPFRSRSSVDLSQPPPQHPQQQQQQQHRPHHQGGNQPTAQGHSNAHARPQTQYNVQRPLYQPPYASQPQYGQQSPTRSQPQYAQQSPTRTQPPYAPQQPAQPSAPYAPQRTYGYPTPSPTSSQTPAPTYFANQQQQQQRQQPLPQPHYASAFGGARPQMVHQQPPQQPAPAPQPSRIVGHPFVPPRSPQPVQAPPLTTTKSSAPQSGGSRRPLPTPAQGRPRPMSMPPQPPPNINGPPASSHGSHHSSTSSLSHIIPKSSFPSTMHRATSPLPNAPRSESPTRRPLPSPTHGVAPLPTTSSPDPRASSVPRTVNMNFNRTPSPEKQQSQSGFPANGISSTNSSPTRPTSQGRALPTSPTAPPDLSQLQRGPNMLARQGTVSAMVSRFGRNTQNNAPSTEQVAPANSSYGPRPPTRASTLPPATSAPPPPAMSDNRTGSTGQGGSDEEEYQTADEEDPPAELNVEALVADAPSPQYGILDLPKRTPAVFRNPSPEAETASPQYGIRNLPARSKSVIDHRIAWERAEQGIIASTPSRSGTSTGGRGAATEPTSPSKSVVSSSPTKVRADNLNIQRAPIQPSQSPQPQTPQQERKLPMPAVRQPQPSYSDRQPSWTLPTADLEKIQKQTHSGNQMTSNAFRFAAMSLAEEHNKSAATPSKPLTQIPALPKPPAQIVPSGPPSPKKTYPFTPRIVPRTISNIDLSLDDAPPPSLRRSPSPAPSNSSSSGPSIPTIRTPEDAATQPSNEPPMIPKINLPEDMDFDDVSPSPPAIQVHVTGEVVSPKPTVPVINLPEVDDTGPVISVTGPVQQTPKTPQRSLPIILNDLASSGTRPHGLPQARSDTSSSIATSSSSGSEPRSKRGGLVCGGCGKGILGRIVSAMGLRWHPQCFNCCTCGELLEHVSSYEHDGRPYCHLDYHEVSKLYISFFQTVANHNI